jgi:hypothetical protein
MQTLVQFIYNAYYAVSRPSIFLALYGVEYVTRPNQDPYSVASPRPNIFIEFFQALQKC